MKSPYIRSWCCVGIMLLGVAVFMLTFIDFSNKILFTVVSIIAAMLIVGGAILHFALVRCPHCGEYLGRLYGYRCPFCGEPYEDDQ